MLRASSAAGTSPYAYTCVIPSGVEWFTLPVVAKKNEQAVHEDPVTTPCWFKLSRRGALVRGFYSCDGRDWTALGKPTILKGEQLLCGVFACAFNSGAINRAVFDNIAIQMGNRTVSPESQVQQALEDMRSDLVLFAELAKSVIFPQEQWWTAFQECVSRLQNAFEEDEAHFRSLFRRHRHRIPRAPVLADTCQDVFEALRLREELERNLITKN